VIAHVPDRNFFPMQVQMGDWVIARWSVEDVHVLRAVGRLADNSAVSGQPYYESFDVSPR
jgi:hypothetical protein